MCLQFSGFAWQRSCSSSAAGPFKQHAPRHWLLQSCSALAVSWLPLCPLLSPVQSAGSLSTANAWIAPGESCRVSVVSFARDHRCQATTL